MSLGIHLKKCFSIKCLKTIWLFKMQMGTILKRALLTALRVLCCSLIILLLYEVYHIKTFWNELKVRRRGIFLRLESIYASERAASVYHLAYTYFKNYVCPYLCIVML